jgi:hypothetical protein
MKTTKSIIVVLFVLLTAQIASAYYCPSTGRWLSRDPIAEPGFQTSQMASVVPKSPQLAPSRWLNRDPIGEPGFELVANRFENKAKTQEVVHFQKGLAEQMMVNPALAMRIQSQLAQLEKSSNAKVDPSASDPYLSVQNDPVSKIDVLGLDVEWWGASCDLLCPCRPKWAVVVSLSFKPIPEAKARRCCTATRRFFCAAIATSLIDYEAQVTAAELYFAGCAR